MPFNGPVIIVCSNGRTNITFSAKDISRLHQFGPKVLPGRFLMHFTREESGKDTLWSQTLKN